MAKRWQQVSNTIALWRLSAQVQMGRHYLLFIPAILLWPALQWGLSLIGVRDDFSYASAQNGLLGLPLYCVAIGLGIRVIAHEVEKRTLEVCYGIPKGAQRVWLAKIAAVSCLLIAALIPLSLVTYFLLTSYPIEAIAAALKGAIFYLVLSMWVGVWLRSELLAGIVMLLVLALNLSGENTSVWSPLFNPLNIEDNSSLDLVAMSIQNHLTYSCLIVAFVVLSINRAEKREVLLGD